MEDISDHGYSYIYSNLYKNQVFTSCYKGILNNEYYEIEEFSDIAFHKIFRDEKFQGKRLIDIGCGPTVHRVAPASKYFSEIVLSDFSEYNREAVKQWLRNEHADKNWKPLLRTEAMMEGYSDIEKGIEEIETRIRQKVKNVIHCDVLKKDPVSEDVGKFDVLTCSGVLESACPSTDIYKAALKRLADYIVPGGGLVILVMLNMRYFYIGEGEDNIKIEVLPVSLELISEALNEAGLQKRHSFIIENSSFENYGGTAIISAVKGTS